MHSMIYWSKQHDLALQLELLPSACARCLRCGAAERCMADCWTVCTFLFEWVKNQTMFTGRLTSGTSGNLLCCLYHCRHKPYNVEGGSLVKLCAGNVPYSVCKFPQKGLMCVIAYFIVSPTVKICSERVMYLGWASKHPYLLQHAHFYS